MNAKALLAAYMNSAYRVALDATTAAVLRVGRRTATLERRLPRACSFGLVSAWNPGSRRLDGAANARAQAELVRMIRRAGHASRGVTNAPGSVWEEPACLLLDPPVDDLDALARRFGQAATLYWRRGGAVRLRAYVDGALGPAREECMDTPFVDWVACAPR